MVDIWFQMKRLHDVARGTCYADQHWPYEVRGFWRASRMKTIKSDVMSVVSKKDEALIQSSTIVAIIGLDQSRNGLS